MEIFWTFGEEQILGGFSVKFLSILLITIYLFINNKKNLFITISIIISFYLTLLSGERSSLFYLLLIFIIFFFFGLNKIAHKLILVSLFIILSLFIFNSYQGVYNRVINNTIIRFF